MPDACRSCRAPIVWARTLKGRRIPLDPEPGPAGNLVINDGVAITAPADAPAGIRFTSHFATCEFAHTHRKRDRKEATRG